MNRKQRRAQGQASGHAGKPPAPSRPAAAPDPAALHEAGVQAYRAGQFAAAADLIGRAIAAAEPVPEFHYNLAVVQKAMGRLEAAAANYQHAIALKPDHVNAHNNLGNVWKTLGHPDKARESFAQALQYNPDNADTHYNLGILCCDLGARGEAEQHFRRCLARDPDDSRGVAILLAHLGASDVPERTTQAQLKSIYEVRSRFWDQEGGYFGAGLVADGLSRHLSPAKLDILDIGCGTGLVGARVRDRAARLDGVDISPAMLEKAKAKGLYDRLFEADLAPFMLRHKDSYDAVLGAATLIHFANLKPLFQAACHCLRDQGLFIFTLFLHQGDPSGAHAASDGGADYAVASHDKLAQSGCFKHSLAYVERLAPETGFSLLELEKTVHERDQEGNPVLGILAVLRADVRQPGDG